MAETKVGNHEEPLGKKRRHLHMQLALNQLVARRKRVLNLSCLLLLLISHGNNITTPHPLIHSCRWLCRNTGWWDNVWSTYSKARFKKTFRVSRATFSFILSRIQPLLVRQTVTEEPIPPELRLALCLYRLAKGRLFIHHRRNSGARCIHCLHNRS